MRHGLAAPRFAAAAAAVVLALLGASYWYTVEPAPAVKVRWRDGIDAAQRTAIERQLLLVDPIVSEGRTVTYNVLDTSRGNLEAIVVNPAIEDTSEIDRQQFTLPADVPYGTRWTWAGRRLPVLRRAGVSAALTAICSLVLLVAAIAAWRRPRPGRPAVSPATPS